MLLQKERYEGRGGLKIISSSFLACQCNACLCTKESGKSGAQIKSSVQKPGDFFSSKKLKELTDKNILLNAFLVHKPK